MKIIKVSEKLKRAIQILFSVSEKEAQNFIKNGKVFVNEKKVEQFKKVIFKGDKIKINDKEKIFNGVNLKFIKLYKPVGYSCQKGERDNVYELIPPIDNIASVGRLDVASEGLLLFTNDGELINRLLRPEFKVERKYIVKINSLATRRQLASMKKGKKLKTVISRRGKKKVIETLYKFWDVEIIESNKNSQTLLVTLKSGKKHEVRKLFSYFGHKVVMLKRISYDGVNLGKLKSGQWQYLTKEEIFSLYDTVGIIREGYIDVMD